MSSATHNLPSIRSAASIWRFNHPDQIGGDVIVEALPGGMHEATGWTLTPIASNFVPGTYRVNDKEGIMMAFGGTIAGAINWAVIDLNQVPTAGYRLTNGPLDAEKTAEYHHLRKLIKQEPDVYDVLALEPHEDGRWLYLIQCPLEWVAPRFVIGLTNTENTDVHILHSCGAKWCAEDAWKTEIRKLNIVPGDEG